MIDTRTLPPSADTLARVTLQITALLDDAAPREQHVYLLAHALAVCALAGPVSAGAVAARTRALLETRLAAVWAASRRRT